MKLVNFKKNEIQKRIIIGSILGILVVIGSITLYKTFALYKEEKTFNVIRGQVPDFSTSDIILSFTIDEKKQNGVSFPKKEDGYFGKAVCENGVKAIWSNISWGLENIDAMGQEKIKCTIEFRVPTNLENVLTDCGKNAVSCFLENAYMDTTNLAYDDTKDNNLRYIGSNPNNYVEFNNELWRIIGVMNNMKDSDGVVRSHLKIIKEESIGEYQWTGSDTYQYNNWQYSTLNNDILNGSVYNSFSENAKSMVSNVVWNLGGGNSALSTTSQYYTLERETLKYEGNPVEWTSHIGMMYPSDYGYATSGGMKGRSSCLKETLYTWSDTTNIECRVNSWLFDKDKNQWTLTPSGTGHYEAFYVASNGLVNANQYNAYRKAYYVCPTLYLNSTVEITGTGNGTRENPYELR